MEAIKLSQQEIKNKYPSCLELQELVTALESDLRGLDQLICKVIVNGLPLSENDEIKFGSTKVEDVQSLEVHVHSAQKIVSDTLSSVIVFIKNLRVDILKLSEELRSGRKPSAQTPFAALIAGVQNLTQALLALKPNLKKHEDSVGFEGRWQSSETQMISALKELMVAYERQDYILVSDVLEYELDMTLENWQAILSESVQKIKLEMKELIG